MARRVTTAEEQSKRSARSDASTFAATREGITKVLKLSEGPVTTAAASKAADEAVHIALNYNLSKAKQPDDLTHDEVFTHKAMHPSTDFDVALFQAIGKAVGTRVFPTEGQKSRKMIIFGTEEAVAETRFIFAEMTVMVWHAALEAHRKEFGKGAKRNLSWINDFCRQAVKTIAKNLESERRHALEALSAADRTRIEAKDAALDQYVETSKASLVKIPPRGRAASKTISLAAARQGKAAAEKTTQSTKGGVEVKRDGQKGRLRRVS